MLAEAGEKESEQADEQTYNQKLEEPIPPTPTTETGTEPTESENIPIEEGLQSTIPLAANVCHASTQTRYGFRSKATQTTNETSNKSMFSKFSSYQVQFQRYN